MITLYYFFARWRKKDVEFLNSFDVSRTVEEGVCSFYIKGDNDYNKIMAHYSKKDSLFSKVRPPEFSTSIIGVEFSKEELDKAKYYALTQIGGESSRYPQPELEYENSVFNFDSFKYGDVSVKVNKKQIAPFHIKKPKWGKNKVCFNLGLEYEFTCFKKDFFQEVLAPLGLHSMEVIHHATGKPLEDTVQLVVPIAKNKLLIEKSAYDIHPLTETGGHKQYALQTLDFFPPFENNFDFHICYTQEDFFGGHRRIIVSKEFCNLLVKHKIIKYDTDNLTPLKSKE